MKAEVELRKKDEKFIELIEKYRVEDENKLERYEFYSKESGSLSVKAASTSSVFDNEVSRNEELKRGITNNFDHYEKYLYFESSSAASSSFGLQFDNSWPKENSTKPQPTKTKRQIVCAPPPPLMSMFAPLSVSKRVPPRRTHPNRCQTRARQVRKKKRLFSLT